jgi:hypothetical protein
MDPVTVLTPVIADVQEAITGVAAPALLVGASVLGLGVAWRIAKRFVRG